MAIRVEFYGVARLQAGCATIEVEARSLKEAIESLAKCLPGFAAVASAEGRLVPGYLANVNGKLFTRDPETLLESGDTLLILSADVGG